jgi:hypothetical protein
MTALLPTPAPAGSADELREFIAEMLAMARIQTELGQTYASIGDDIGLAYAMRSLIIYVKTAAATTNDLKAHKNRRGAA